MKFKNILILLVIIFVNSCAEFDTTSSKTINSKLDKKYKNSGFALIYNKNLDIKVLDDRSLNIYHKYFWKVWVWIVFQIQRNFNFGLG